jgi:hypothetical protein
LFDVTAARHAVTFWKTPPTCVGGLVVRLNRTKLTGVLLDTIRTPPHNNSHFGATRFAIADKSAASSVVLLSSLPQFELIGVQSVFDVALFDVSASVVLFLKLNLSFGANWIVPI